MNDNADNSMQKSPENWERTCMEMCPGVNLYTVPDASIFIANKPVDMPAGQHSHSEYEFMMPLSDSVSSVIDDSTIILGVSASSFEPERAVTRQEMAAMMYRFMEHLELLFTNDNNEFTDDNLIDAWAKESIMQLKGTGIISGRTDNKFDPYGVSTRAEVAAVLRRLIEYVLK